MLHNSCVLSWQWVGPFSFIRSTILPLASASGSDWLHCDLIALWLHCEFDLILYQANKAIFNKYGVLDILSHMVRPMNTHSESGDFFREINSFF